MEKYYDIVIVGAGPAGLAAAITAKTAGPEISAVILEKKEKAAKKLSASGNGRGNLSNERCESLEQVLRFFSQSGIAVRIDEEGRIYPYSEEAAAVSETFVRRAEELGVEILTDNQVTGVEAGTDGGFRIFISTEEGDVSVECRSLLIATGGKSFAAYGSTGDGYKFARTLGHRVTPLVPALTAVEVKEDISNLKGLRAKVSVSLFDSGNMTFRETGEIQFREDSISGICVMNLSSQLPAACKGERGDSFKDLRIAVNFVPDFDAAGLLDFMRSRQQSCARQQARMQRQCPEATASDMLKTIIKKQLIPEILRRAGIPQQKSAEQMTMEDILKTANALRSFSLTPCGRKGWKEAQVTKGGVSMEEICQSTMESKIASGLYFAGEILDYDGPCGGYNLNNAWLTGIKAGKAMAERIEKIKNVQNSSDKA